jgi:N-methylhydantoinase A
VRKEEVSSNLQNQFFIKKSIRIIKHKIYKTENSGKGAGMTLAQDAMTIGIDVGGTFTDVLALDNSSGALTALKVPSTSGKPAQGVMDALGQLSSQALHSTIIHGTTVATNAVLEERGARTALITTRHFRDVLEIGRQSRENIYDLRRHGRPKSLVPRHLRLEISERMDYQGNVLQKLALHEVSQILQTLKDEQAESVAICLLHSYANRDHERRLAEAIKPHFPYVSISSDINAEFREYERTNTVVLNAFVMPLVNRYLEDLEDRLREAGWQGRLLIVQSNGGMITTSLAKHRPLSTVMSGPAAGVAATQSLIARLGLTEAVAFDMGGTSTDVCLIHQGKAAVTAERRVGGQPVRLVSVAIESIGAGGGSIAWVDPAGAIKVGPQSAGATPGPACYNRGGTAPTVTDSNLVLGYLNPYATYGRQINLDLGLAQEAIKRFGKPFGMSLQETAQGIIDIANANMIRALRLVSVQKGHDLRHFTLVAFGGAGPLHAGRLARLLHISKVIVPPFSSSFSALGCLISDVRMDTVKTYRCQLAELSSTKLAAAFQSLEEEAIQHLNAEGYEASGIQLQYSCDLRYIGQKYELNVAQPETPLNWNIADLGSQFNARHEALYAYCTNEEIECINLRLTALVSQRAVQLNEPSAGTAKDSLAGKRPAFFPESGSVNLPIYMRDQLNYAAVLQGPAVIEDEWSTTLVYPGQKLRVDHWGTLIIEENQS